MKCPKCGFENRPDARFCKQCGQPLQAQAAPPVPPTPPGAVCPACGATAKPGARFCPRCGKPLPTAPMPPLAHPPTTQPSMPSAPSAQPPTYAQPPASPPPAVPAAPERRFPRWIWWAGGIAAFVCVAALVVTAILLGPKLLGGAEEPTAAPVPVASLTVEASPIEPPATEAPTATPTAKPTPTETATPPPPKPPLAEVSIVPSAPELHVGGLLTVTVTVTNTGEMPFDNLHCQLLGEWEPFLKKMTPTVVILPESIGPGISRTTTFVLEAIQVGTASLEIAVTMETPGQPPVPGGASSESITVSVFQ